MPCCDVVANCRKSLGMHSGAIPDSAITASSSYDSASVGPSNGRSPLTFTLYIFLYHRCVNEQLAESCYVVALRPLTATFRSQTGHPNVLCGASSTNLHLKHTKHYYAALCIHVWTMNDVLKGIHRMF